MASRALALRDEPREPSEGLFQVESTPPAKPSRSTAKKVQPPADESEPIVIPAQDASKAWEDIRDVVHKYFEIDDEVHGNEVGDNLITKRRIEPERSATPRRNSARRGQTDPQRYVSRQGYVQMTPTDQGFLLHVHVFKDVEDPDFPQPVSARLQIKNPYDGDGVEDTLAEGWIAAGRDVELENRLRSQLMARFGSSTNQFPGDQGPFLPGAEEAVAESFDHPPATFLDRAWMDQLNFYSHDSMVSLGVVLGIGAISANTTLDQHFRDQYQSHWRTSTTDNVAKVFKQFGEGQVTVPIYIGTALLEYGADRYPVLAPVAEWGNNSLRGVMAGGIPLLVLQQLTGGARPVDTAQRGSYWHPFQAPNGVSGHAFMGSIPFLVAADMADNPWLKAGLYVGSTMTGLSRINDDAHYLSQVIIGWTLGFLSVQAVRQTEDDVKNYRIVPLPFGTGMGVGIEFRR